MTAERRECNKKEYEETHFISWNARKWEDDNGEEACCGAGCVVL